MVHLSQISDETLTGFNLFSFCETVSVYQHLKASSRTFRRNSVYLKLTWDQALKAEELKCTIIQLLEIFLMCINRLTKLYFQYMAAWHGGGEVASHSDFRALVLQ